MTTPTSSTTSALAPSAPPRRRTRAASHSGWRATQRSSLPPRCRSSRSGTSEPRTPRNWLPPVWPGIVDRRHLRQAPITVGDGAWIGRIQERERLHVAQLQAEHAQDHVGQRRAQQFGIGEARPRIVVFFAVQPNADARPDASATPLALVGGSLRYRLDVQPLDLAAAA